MKRTQFAAIAFLAACLMAVPHAHANTVVNSNDLSDPNIVAAQKQLSATKYITADFTEFTPDGTTLTGKIHILRPQGLRMDYDGANADLLVVNRTALYRWNGKTKEASTRYLKGGWADLLLRQRVSFGSSLSIVSNEQVVDSISITVIDPSAPDAGSLTFQMSGNPPVLMGWKATDHLGKITTVSLRNISYNSFQTNESSFEFVPPEKPLTTTILQGHDTPNKENKGKDGFSFESFKKLFGSEEEEENNDKKKKSEEGVFANPFQ